jgi:DNA-binding Lrp family transcriptional regulator
MKKTEQIDEIDAKILKDLLCDGRKEFKQIAKEANVSKDVIWQHYSNLKKKGVIVGSTIQLDYQSLGYGGAASFFVDVPVQEQANVANLLRKIPGLYDVYRWGSHSRLWAVSDFLKTDQIENVKSIIRRISPILKLQVEIWTNQKNTPENLSVLNSLHSESIEETTGKDDAKDTPNVDDIDLKLIEKLKTNSRASFSEIGNEMGISTSTVIRRYNSLWGSKIIRPVIQINPIRIGYFGEAGFRLTINSQSNILAVSADICKIPDIIGVVTTIGVYDLTVFAAVKSLEHFFSLQEEIANVSGIKEMDTSALLNEFNVMPLPGEHTSSF